LLAKNLRTLGVLVNEGAEVFEEVFKEHRPGGKNQEKAGLKQDYAAALATAIK